jgi:hypothetical protein
LASLHPGPHIFVKKRKQVCIQSVATSENFISGLGTDNFEVHYDDGLWLISRTSTLKIIQVVS